LSAGTSTRLRARDKEERPEVQVIERIAEHYDTQEMEFGRIYSWCPECVVVECKCGKRRTLTRSALIEVKPDCECGADNTASVREEVVLELFDEDYEAHHHPWHYDTQAQAEQHLRDEAASPEDSPRRYNDVTSGFVGNDEERWKKARTEQALWASK
jgi:hypothetical protein